MSDARVTLSRPELAPFEYEGIARAIAYDELRLTQSTVGVAAILASANSSAEQVSQLLYGERFDILRRDGAFVWGQSRRDGYVGWVEACTLSTDLVAPSHWVIASRAAVLSRPEIRAPTLEVIGMNALVVVAEVRKAFSLVDGLGWIASRQLAPIGTGLFDPTEVAALFLGVPYVWGARDGGGLDCSGLVQQAMFAAGQSCPRDADQQAALGVEIAPEALAAGDLVAWKGHIGMMLDARRLIHANAHHMAVAIEPLESAILRIAETATGRPTACRRLNLGL